MDVFCLFKLVIGFEFCSIVNVLILIFGMLINIYVFVLYLKMGYFNLYLSFMKIFFFFVSGIFVLVC